MSGRKRAQVHPSVLDCSSLFDPPPRACSFLVNSNELARCDPPRLMSLPFLESDWIKETIMLVLIAYESFQHFNILRFT